MGEPIILTLLAETMEMVLSSFIILFSLFIVATLYSSVGHGGASGYLAVLSLTVYASQDPSWLRQYAWSLNLLVASLAFWAYSRVGFFNYKCFAISPGRRGKTSEHIDVNLSSSILPVPNVFT